MRSLNKLLIIIKKDIKKDKNFSRGICYNITKLYENKKITDLEYKIIGNFIKNSKPINKFNNIFWWNPGDKKPRLEWLESNINYWWKIKKKN